MFERIKKESFQEVFSILEETFPVSELRIAKDQKILFDNPHYCLYGIRNEEKLLQGLIAVWDVDTFFFLEYFVIKKEFRNGGFGGEKLDEFVEMLGKPVILEVEPPEDELTTRRVGFYKRHGFHLNNYGYLQPPLREGQPLLPLKLMSFPKEMKKEEFEKYKKALYRVVYGC